MIVKFFGNRGGGSAKSSMDYLRGKDKERYGATVLRGDPDLSQSIAESLEFKNNYTVGCLSFEERDLPMKEKREIMDKFEKTIFAGLKEAQYNISWIEHTDKGRLELNFYIPNVEMTTQKRLQPYYDRADRPLVDNFKKVINHEYGLTNPDAPEKKQFLKMDLNTPRSVKELKEGVHNLVLERVAEGEIQSQEQLIDIFDRAGLEVTRTTKRSVSIKNPEGGRNIRFDGELYGKEFYEKTRTSEAVRDYARGQQNREPEDHRLDNDRSYERDRAKLEREVRGRAERNNALYPQLENNDHSLDGDYGSQFIGLGVDRVASNAPERGIREISESENPIRGLREIYQHGQSEDSVRQERESPVHLHGQGSEEQQQSLENIGRHERIESGRLKGFINELSIRTKDTLQGIRETATRITERARGITAFMSKAEERKQGINESYRTLRDFNEEIQGLDREVGRSNECAQSREFEIQRTDRTITQVERQVNREINKEQDRGFSISR